MSKQIVTAELSEELVLFLTQEGYSHIFSIGEFSANNVPGQNTDDYLLLPLKPDDVRLKFEEADQLINPIESDEVKEMAVGVDAIRFLIEVPADLYHKYLNIN
ncbi:hypothetical protein [Lacibacter sp.]|uniref:hypothetical protein n=1 Tax=Lacibacter sp. TaxID=1915409 RepID=UPI002B4B6C85|nr:hypothetical protein [Lacibacter sp.]HLP37752.1 hypothetical protein [Lacibacter sp.]